MATTRRGETATPARTTRSRPNRSATPARGPLPAIPTSQSFAYGAAGKVRLGQQVTSSAAEVEEAFADQTRVEEAEMPPPPPPQSILRERTPRVPNIPRVSPPKVSPPAAPMNVSPKYFRRSIRRHEHSIADSTSEIRRGTGIQQSALYEEKKARLVEQARAQALVVRSPVWSERLTWMLLGIAAFTGVICTLLALFAVCPMPSVLVPTQESFLHRLGLLTGFHSPPVAVNVDLRPLNHRLDLHDKSIRHLNDLLPINMEPKRTPEIEAVQNIDMSIRQVNYFSPGQGALVDPHYTSRMHGRARDLLGWATWASGFSYFNMPEIYANPPIAALMEWRESAQCWCSAPSTDEKAQAQLGIRLGRRIYPEKLVIEHIPSSGTRDIAAAPRQLEIWAQMDSVQEAQQIKKALDEKVHISQAYECGAPPKGEQNWICLGSDQYDIHHSRYTQAFLLHGNWEGIAISTNRMVVRATTNWGADHTCIYRLRMNGFEAPQVVVKEEEL